MQNKIISIIIPSYNVGAYLENTITSLLDLNRDDYEILPVNDGSSDNTLDIIKKYEEAFPHIIRGINKSNGGYGSVINYGIREAKGKYFKIIDGDDWVNSDNFKRLVEKLEALDVDMVLTDFDIVNVSRNKLYKKTPMLRMEADKVYRFSDLKVERDIFMHSCCFKTSLLKNNPISITEKCFYTDLEYVIKAINYVETCIYFDFSVYQYQIGREGQSVSFEGIRKNARDLEKVIQNIEIYFEVYGIKNNTDFINFKIAEACKSYITYLLIFPISRKIKADIIKFDKELKKSDEIIYRLSNNKKLFILRKSNYILYPVYAVYTKIKKKIQRES